MGRELDAQVAEKVFGLNTHPSPLDKHDLWITGRPNGRALPYYSTEIEPAFKVVAKMREMGYRFSMNNTNNDYTPWNAQFYKADRQGSAITESIPDSICLAALQAISERGEK